MTNMLRRLFGQNKPTDKTNDFYQFVHDASSSDKLKILKQVIRKADEDQRDLVKRYEQTHGTKGVAC